LVSRAYFAVNKSVRRFIVIRPCSGQMMMASVFFIVGIPRECHPTQDWEQQAEPCGRQAQYDADPDCEWHPEKHPKKASLRMSFIDVPKSRNNAEQRRDFIVRMPLFFADWC
jgi:hypothetical protein